MRTPEFSAHNIRLDDGTFTRPEAPNDWAAEPWCVSAKRVLALAFPGDKSRHSVLDLGCLEGGYTVEFARMGFQSTGLEIRGESIAACRWVQSRVDLPNLRFVQDDAWNAASYGTFDAVFCCGLLYHMDRPRAFIRMLSQVATRVLILQTHFATERLKNVFNLSPMTEHENAAGRWFTEFTAPPDLQEKESCRWASWDNLKSFWLTRGWLLQCLSENGFDLVFEQFDSLAPGIVDAMNVGYYQTQDRGTFVGIRTGIK